MKHAVRGDDDPNHTTHSADRVQFAISFNDIRQPIDIIDFVKPYQSP